MLADDLLDGAEAISEFIGGRMTARKVYRLAEIEELPVVRVGRRIYARKSEIIRAFSSQKAGS